MEVREKGGKEEKKNRACYIASNPIFVLSPSDEAGAVAATATAAAAEEEEQEMAAGVVVPDCRTRCVP